MRRIFGLAAMTAAMLAVPLAGTAAAEQPDNVATHVSYNHETEGASGNPRASSGPGYTLGMLTPCFLVVLEDKKNRPECRPEFG